MQVSEITKKEKDEAAELYRKFVSINAQDATRQYSWPEHFPKIQNGGITAAVVTVAHPTSPEMAEPIYESTLRFALRSVSNWYRIIESFGDKAMLVETADDIRKAKQSGKFGFIFGMQGSAYIEELGVIPAIQKLGIRITGLTYMRRNFIGDGCLEAHSPAGLSDYGIKVVEELNRAGIVIDLSHSHTKTALDAIEVSKQPCIFSHSAPRALRDVIRNASEEEIVAISEKGGVVGIYGLYWVLPNAPSPSMEDYLDCIDHVVKVSGVDHVGIGLDQSHARKDSESASFTQRYPELTKLSGNFMVPHDKRYASGLMPENLLPVVEGLVARGYSDSDVEKILGGNFLRVFSRAWK
ncbi:MAG: dipeptidase [Thaumarchaeota archaeon]|nr:dipeptidase [Nitrososphaerota archaeon]